VPDSTTKVYQTVAEVLNAEGIMLRGDRSVAIDCVQPAKEKES
jgi:hypothetical protein